jgi:predicted NUDIX family NTP pyrophosphohydrolase
MRSSAGLLPFRRANVLELLIAHPGGPFWAKKDVGAWSIVKGELEPDEDPLAGALREFAEETGWAVPSGADFTDLGTVRLKSGKQVRCWAFEGDFDPATLAPGTFTTVIRGRTATFPEVDRVAWVTPAVAETLLNPAQVDFIRRLVPH